MNETSTSNNIIPFGNQLYKGSWASQMGGRSLTVHTTRTPGGTLTYMVWVGSKKPKFRIPYPKITFW